MDKSSSSLVWINHHHQLFDSKETATAMEAATQKTLTKPMQKETFGHADDWGEAAAVRREQHPTAGDVAR